MTVSYPWLKRSPNGGFLAELEGCSKDEKAFRKRTLREVANGTLILSSDGTGTPAVACCKMAKYSFNTGHSADCDGRGVVT